MRFVIKIGTSILSDEHYRLDRDFLDGVIEQIAEMHRAGNQIVIVSSGAVAAGRTEITFEREKKSLPYRQALAAVGQAVLMRVYADLFKKHDITTAQALLTNYDFVNRENFLNTKNVFEVMLNKNVVPVVNENDVTTIAELKFGDNDMLSAKTAAMVSADCLIVLTDVSGLFEEDPKRNPKAKIISVVKKIDDSIKKLATDTRKKSSLGGMVTKLEAAEYVTSVGIPMFIVNGKKKNVLKSLVDVCSEKLGDLASVSDHPGTLFLPQADKTASPKKWLRPKIQKNAWIIVDSGAVKAILSMGKSLLPPGITGVHGKFKRGDVVMIKGPEGNIAYGQVNYDSNDLDKIKKCKSCDIEDMLGYSFEDEIIHRDRMVIQH